MKQIIQISLDASRDDVDFETEFLGQKFHIRRFGTDGDLDEATDLLLRWNKKADAIGLGGVKFANTYKPGAKLNKEIRKLLKLGSQVHTQVTTGATLPGEPPALRSTGKNLSRGGPEARQPRSLYQGAAPPL